MDSWLLLYLMLGIAAIPFIYYGIALFSAWRFFTLSARKPAATTSLHSAGKHSEAGAGT